MKTIIAAMLAAVAAPAMAQSAPAPQASTAAGFSVDGTSIEALAADPRAKAVLDKELPQLLTHPAFDQFKSMTLSQLAPMSQGSITDEKLAVVQAELAKIK